MFRRNIRPPMPRRDADHLRQFVNAVCCTAAVAAGDHESVLDVRQRIFDGRDKIAFPFAADLRCIDLAGFCESVDPGAFAEGSDNYDVWGRFCRFTDDRGPFSGYLFNIRSKISGSYVDNLKILRRHEYICRYIAENKPEITILIARFDREPLC